MAKFEATTLPAFKRITVAITFLYGITNFFSHDQLLSGKDPAPNSFTVVPRRDWTTRANCVNASRFRLPIQRILLLPSNTTECWNELECLKELRNLQKEHVEMLNDTDVPYNFMLAGDNRIYEGRGWNCSSSYEHSGVKLLTIAFLGKE